MEVYNNKVTTFRHTLHAGITSCIDQDKPKKLCLTNEKVCDSTLHHISMALQVGVTRLYRQISVVMFMYYVYVSTET